MGDSNGGSGKSIMFNNAMDFLVKNNVYINGGEPELHKDKFLFDGVTANTSYVVFDDIDARFPLRKVYANITGKFSVNPKGLTAYKLKFNESPKIAFTSKYHLPGVCVINLAVRFSIFFRLIHCFYSE